MRQAPGVAGAAMATAPPLSGMNLQSSFEILGQSKDPSQTPVSRVSAVSGDYARTMGTPLLRGRMLTDDDTDGTPFVAVINQAFARKYFADRDPLGRQINLGGKETGMLKPYTIVGILADQADRNVGSAVEPFMLVPQQQIPTTSLFYQGLLKTVVSFVVKTRGNVAVASEMRSIFRQTAPSFALDGFQTMREVIDQNTFSQRLGLYLTGSFAGLAVAMVIAGLYGVLAQLVSYRRREIGIRMALGATRESVARMVLKQGSVLIGAGLAAGILSGLIAGRLLQSFLYQVQPADLWTYMAVALSLLLIGGAASFVPAHNAASIQPMEALRDE
jgi:predicted permease